MKKEMNKKAQVWSIDLAVGLIIFLVGVLILFFYAMNLRGGSSEILDDLFLTGNSLANNLLSEGSPTNWTETNVVFPGLLSENNGNKINQTKLQYLYNLNQDYANLKKILKTKYDFYIYFSEQMIIEGGAIDGIGKPGVDRDNIVSIENPKNLVKIERVSVYNNNPIILNIYLWN